MDIYIQLGVLLIFTAALSLVINAQSQAIDIAFDLDKDLMNITLDTNTVNNLAVDKYYIPTSQMRPWIFTKSKTNDVFIGISYNHLDSVRIDYNYHLEPTHYGYTEVGYIFPMEASGGNLPETHPEWGLTNYFVKVVTGDPGSEVAISFLEAYINASPSGKARVNIVTNDKKNGQLIYFINSGS